MKRTIAKITAVGAIGLILLGAQLAASKGGAVPSYDFNGDGVDGNMADLVWYAGSAECDADSPTKQCDQGTVNAMASAMGITD